MDVYDPKKSYRPCTMCGDKLLGPTVTYCDKTRCAVYEKALAGPKGLSQVEQALRHHDHDYAVAPPHMHIRCTKCGWERAGLCKAEEVPKTKGLSPPTEQAYLGDPELREWILAEMESRTDESFLNKPPVAVCHACLDVNECCSKSKQVLCASSIKHQLAKFLASRQEPPWDNPDPPVCGPTDEPVDTRSIGDLKSITEAPACAKCRSIGPHKKRHCGGRYCDVDGEGHRDKNLAPEHFHFTCQGCHFEWATAVNKQPEAATEPEACQPSELDQNRKNKAGSPRKTGREQLEILRHGVPVAWCCESTPKPKTRESKCHETSDRCEEAAVPYHNHPCRQFGQKQKRKHRSFRRICRNVWPWAMIGSLLIGAGFGITAVVRGDMRERRLHFALPIHKWAVWHQGVLESVERHGGTTLLCFEDGTEIVTTTFDVVRLGVLVKVSRRGRARRPSWCHVRTQWRLCYDKDGEEVCYTN